MKEPGSAGRDGGFGGDRRSGGFDRGYGGEEVCRHLPSCCQVHFGGHVQASSPSVAHSLPYTAPV